MSESQSAEYPSLIPCRVEFPTPREVSGRFGQRGWESESQIASPELLGALKGSLIFQVCPSSITTPFRQENWRAANTPRKTNAQPMDSIYRSRSGAEIRAIPASCDARASFAFASLLGKTSLQLSRGLKEDETNGGGLLKRYLLGGGFEGNQKDNSHVGGPKSKPQFCHIPIL